jgi:hypothetical protein
MQDLAWGAFFSINEKIREHAQYFGDHLGGIW